jgi:hypothetical protein
VAQKIEWVLWTGDYIKEGCLEEGVLDLVGSLYRDYRSVLWSHLTRFDVRVTNNSSDSRNACGTQREILPVLSSLKMWPQVSDAVMVGWHTSVHFLLHL